MRFHTSHADIVELSDDRKMATKSSYIQNAAVFSERPIAHDEIICFRIFKTTENEFRKAAIGFTVKNPNDLRTAVDLKCLPEIGLGRYLSINSSGSPPNRRTTDIHMVHYSQKGSLYYGINGKLEATHEMGSTGGPLYLFMLIGSLREVELIENTLSQKVMDGYKHGMMAEQEVTKSIMMMASGVGGLSMAAMDTEEEMKFHKHQNQMLVNQSQKSIEPLDIKYNVAFSSKPLSGQECISFTSNGPGSVRIGLTTKNPTLYTSSDLNKQFSDQQFGPTEALLLTTLRFCESDALHVAMVKHDTHLGAIVGLNGSGRCTKKLTGKRYWLVMRLQTQTRITILDQFIAESTTPQQPVITPQQPVVHNPVQIKETTEKENIARTQKNAVPEAPPRKTVAFQEPIKEEPKDKKPEIVPKAAKIPIYCQAKPILPVREQTMRNEADATVHHYEPMVPSIYNKIFNRELTVIKNLGTGAQGEVRLVSTPLLGRMAGKFFNRKDVTSAMSKYEIRELDILARLNSHRFIVSIYGFVFEDEQSPQPMGFLMEFMENGSMHGVIHELREIDGRKQFKVNYARQHMLNWIQQAASAFNFMHGAGIVHRDIKPLNLLLSNDYEQLRVCDLGLSGEVRMDMTMRIGTYIYMAPEVLQLANSQKESENYNAKCDVYSLAITMWELIHRRTPYYKETDPAILVMKKICTKQYRPAIKTELASEEVFNLVKSCWSADPALRPTMLEICKFAHNKLVEAEKKKMIDLHIRV